MTRSHELIASLDKEFAKQDRAELRKRLTERAIVFDVVATPEDIPSDQQLLDNDILIPFAGSETRTINSPIAVRGADKVQPRMPPSVGQHSDEVLKEALVRPLTPIEWAEPSDAPVPVPTLPIEGVITH